MKTIYYQLILDRSGSMGDIREVTISSFNEQVSAIQSLTREFPDQPVRVSLTLFNHRITPVVKEEDPATVHPLTPQDYEPEGTTSLLDAIGISVTRLQEKLKSGLEANEAEVIVVIITDGHENSSEHYTLANIARLISELEQTGKWKFSYLGTTFNAIDIASSMNIRFQASHRFQKEETSETFKKVSTYLRKSLIKQKSETK
ncbi:MAG: VWA domain-containing protein [Ignavibacteriaceae bacterium]|nr:VWA domain-containing protein [Ignavibacteriaceae bacterium]